MVNGNNNNNNYEDPAKDTHISHYYSITCLPITKKLLIRITGEKFYLQLERNGLLANEHAGCRKRLRGMKDQLIIKELLGSID